MDLFNKLPQWLVWGLLFPLVVLNGWLALKVLQYFQPFLTIFVFAAVLAFILNYPVQFLQKRGIQHSYAVIFVGLTGLIILLAIGITVVPLILEESSELVNLLPKWIDLVVVVLVKPKLGFLEPWLESLNNTIKHGQVFFKRTKTYK